MLWHLFLSRYEFSGTKTSRWNTAARFYCVSLRSIIETRTSGKNARPSADPLSRRVLSTKFSMKHSRSLLLCFIEKTKGQATAGNSLSNKPTTRFDGLKSWSWKEPWGVFFRLKCLWKTVAKSWKNEKCSLYKKNRGGNFLKSPSLARPQKWLLCCWSTQQHFKIVQKFSEIPKTRGLPTTMIGPSVWTFGNGFL